ncbi:FtsB family cell division protein [Hutsoniella sourekii]|uniref:FtsB family cell division protein n=1 Tax=Hutsoniella sourekii TaxID=87650 RepID=UPI0004BAD382|nr:septum formation initiator family protein [Hutsoniella sourekii]
MARRQVDEKIIHLTTLSQPSRSKGRLQWNPFTLIILIGGMLTLIVGGQFWHTLRQTSVKQAEYEEAKFAYQEALDQNRQVQAEYQHLHDSDYLANVARRDYYYSKPGEIIFELGEEESPVFQENQQ